METGPESHEIVLGECRKSEPGGVASASMCFLGGDLSKRNWILKGLLIPVGSRNPFPCNVIDCSRIRKYKCKIFFRFVRWTGQIFFNLNVCSGERKAILYANMDKSGSQFVCFLAGRENEPSNPNRPPAECTAAACKQNNGVTIVWKVVLTCSQV